ncbi:MAG TPA: hypothetical protein VE326_04755 [Candidatus Binatia bacterium]|nr:hypothetical protein [Candidatus Binatia bacterium]
MRRLFLPTLLVYFLTLPPAAFGNPLRSRGSASVIVGGQTIDTHDGSRTEAGLDLAIQGVRWPVAVALFASRSAMTVPSATEGGDFHYKFDQLGLGIRRDWSRGLFQPYTSAGAEWGEERVKEDYDDNGMPFGFSSHGLGWWAAGGGLFRASSRLRVGAGVRYSALNQDFGRYSTTYKVWSIHARLGWSWPALDD